MDNEHDERIGEATPRDRAGEYERDDNDMVVDMPYSGSSTLGALRGRLAGAEAEACARLGVSTELLQATTLARRSVCRREGTTHSQDFDTALEAGALLDLQGNENETLLMTAVAAGCPTCVRNLLDRGADLEVRNIYGSTALEMATRRAEDEISAMLLAAHNARMGCRDPV